MKNTVLITGASKGIGRACALAFAKRGYSLFLTGFRHMEELEETEVLARAYGVSVYLAEPTDVSDYEMCVKHIWERIAALNLKIDILVNNAGISYIGLLQDMSFEAWNRVIDTNLSSVFTMCKHAIPGMLREGHGKILNISSVWGSVGASCEVAYSAAKGGMNTFTKALAKELAPSNIQVNAIAFGAIDTDMNHFLSIEEKVALIDEIPAGRLATAEEAGEFIARIADSGTYLTGAIISMDGGWC